MITTSTVKLLAPESWCFLLLLQPRQRRRLLSARGRWLIYECVFDHNDKLHTNGYHTCPISVQSRLSKCNRFNAIFGYQWLLSRLSLSCVPLEVKRKLRCWLGLIWVNNVSNMHPKLAKYMNWHLSSLSYFTSANSGRADDVSVSAQPTQSWKRGMFV